MQVFRSVLLNAPNSSAPAFNKDFIILIPACRTASTSKLGNSERASHFPSWAAKLEITSNRDPKSHCKIWLGKKRDAWKSSFWFKELRAKDPIVLWIIPFPNYRSLHSTEKLRVFVNEIKLTSTWCIFTFNFPIHPPKLWYADVAGYAGYACHPATSVQLTISG